MRVDSLIFSLALLLSASGCDASWERSFATEVELVSSSTSTSGVPLEPPVDVAITFTDVFNLFKGSDGHFALEMHTGPLLAGERDADQLVAITSTYRAYDTGTCAWDHSFELSFEGEIVGGDLEAELVLDVEQSGDCSGTSLNVRNKQRFDVVGAPLTGRGEHLTAGPAVDSPWPVQF